MEKDKIQEAQTWESMYEMIKQAPQCKQGDFGQGFSMKEFKATQPRTFTELFDPDSQQLKENRTYAELYEKELKKESIKLSEEIYRKSQLKEFHKEDPEGFDEHVNRNVCIFCDGQFEYDEGDFDGSDFVCYECLDSCPRCEHHKNKCVCDYEGEEEWYDS